MGVNKGKYLNLDFAYLKDLGIIDFRLRMILFKMINSIEHYLKLRILKYIELINEEKFCQAEALLSKELEENKTSRETLQLAVWFYFKLNEFDDEVLEKNKFSRHEVLEGLERIEKLVVEV